MNQEIIKLYDEYTHAPLPRRVFMRRLAKLAGGTAAAAALIPQLENNYAQAAMVMEDDPRIKTAWSTIRGKTGPVKAYTAWPAEGSKFPAIVVVHENRGLNPHIQDVARRMAVEGFLAFAVDGLSPLGGTPADEDKAREMIGQLNGPDTIANYVAAVHYAQGHGLGNGKVGIVGFCWGGGMVNQVLVHSDEVDAGVAYYGRQASAADVEKIQAPLMLHYAGMDDRINAGIPAFEEALQKGNKTYVKYIYDGVNHAFNNDTNAARYDKDAATLAWGRTVRFFKQYVR